MWRNIYKEERLLSVLVVLEGIAISQKDFNFDMDTYLSKRKKPAAKKKAKPKAEEFEEEELEYYKREKNVIDKFLDFILGEAPSADVKEIDEIEEEIEEEIEKEEEEFEQELENMEDEPEKPGFFTKIKKWFMIDDDEVMYEEVDSGEIVNEEIKEALKIQNRWLSKLPGKEIKKFKESEDYKTYIRILEKYNLIKKD